MSNKEILNNFFKETKNSEPTKSLNSSSTTDNLKFENRQEDKSDPYTKTFGEVSYEDDYGTKDENISDPILVKYDEVELSYLASDPLLQGNGLLPFPWLSNLDSSNPLTIHDGHAPDSYYLQVRTMNKSYTGH